MHAISLSQTSVRTDTCTYWVCVTDLDECAYGDEFCEQTCNNFNKNVSSEAPGYLCGCVHGYEMHANSLHCVAVNG